MAITAEKAAKIERMYNARNMIRECMAFDQRSGYRNDQAQIANETRQCPGFRQIGIADKEKRFLDALSDYIDFPKHGDALMNVLITGTFGMCNKENIGEDPWPAISRRRLTEVVDSSIIILNVLRCL